MNYDPWSIAGMNVPSSIESLMKVVDNRCSREGWLLDDVDAPETERIVARAWMPADKEGGRSAAMRSVVAWATMDPAAYWYSGNFPTKKRNAERPKAIGRYRNIVVCRSIDMLSYHTARATGIVLFTKADETKIREKLNEFVDSVSQALSEAQAEAYRLSRLGIAAGWQPKVPQTPRHERIQAIADALSDTPDAGEARRIVDEWDGSTSIEGRLKKLKQMAKMHGVWKEGLGL